MLVVVEFLTFSVEPAELAAWLGVEEAVWSRYLETVPGFIRKEMWQPADRPGTMHAVIWWESRDAWKAVTDEEVAMGDARMGEWLRRPRAQEFVVLRTG